MFVPDENTALFTAAQVSNPLLPVIHLHEGCQEGKPAVHTLIQWTSLLVQKAGEAPNMTMHKQARAQIREPGFGEGHMKSKIGAISGPIK